MPQRLLAEILEPRARELFELVRDNLRQGGVLEALGAGAVLAGGGARLNSIAQTAESVLRRPARIGHCAPLHKMPQQLTDPEFAVSVGTIWYAHRAVLARGAQQQSSFRSKLRALFQIA
jgi:cell division protein FtsA